MGPDEATLHMAQRVRRALERPNAFIEAAGDLYRVRPGPDRRRRTVRLGDGEVFRRLVREAGLKPREGGGWRLIPRRDPVAAPPPGRPGVIEGERVVGDAEGRLKARRANLGESPLAWLARRRDTVGRPWLSQAEVAAGERLREDFYRSGMLGRLTMDWSAGPKGSGGLGLNPMERGVAAKARVRAALDAAGPGLSPILERICMNGSALEAAERALGLPKRSGKTVLRLALSKLVQHYRIG